MKVDSAGDYRSEGVSQSSPGDQKYGNTHQGSIVPRPTSLLYLAHGEGQEEALALPPNVVHSQRISQLLLIFSRFRVRLVG